MREQEYVTTHHFLDVSSSHFPFNVPAEPPLPLPPPYTTTPQPHLRDLPSPSVALDATQPVSFRKLDVLLPTAIGVGNVNAVGDYAKLEQHSGGRIVLEAEEAASQTSTSTATGLGMNWYSDIPSYVTLGDECSAKDSSRCVVCLYQETYVLNAYILCVWMFCTYVRMFVCSLCVYIIS